MAKIKIYETFLRFAIPVQMKAELQQLADGRRISLSALVRLILSEYLKNNKSV